MRLLFIILQLAVTIIASSVHKYPYVFLLDVGNEEIENLNTEQIRLTIPGGSLAVKYPSTGEGDTIGHVRVSGIDFGTNLKASIVQGGPGYKYVVLVFVGNPGVSYDAVVTIETVPNIDGSSKMNSDTENQSSEDSNDSAEETDSTEQKSTYSENALISQSSSNVYKNVNSEHAAVNHNDNGNGDETQNDDEEESADEDDKHKQQNNQDYSGDNILSNTYLEGDNLDDDNDNVPDIKPLATQNNERYGKYEAFKPLIIGGVRFFPQAAIYSQDGYSKPIYDPENHVDDEENEQVNDIINEIDYKDSNNNLSSDGSPVEY